MEGLPSLDYINIIAHEQGFVKREFEKIEKKIAAARARPLPPIRLERLLPHRGAGEGWRD